MKKKLLFILLATVALVSLFAMTAHAAPQGYGVYVGETQVTSSNMNDVLGDGTVSFTPAAGNDPAVLCLNGATITKMSVNYTKTAYIFASQDLDIVLSGNNQLGHGLDQDTAGWGILLQDFHGDSFELRLMSYTDGNLTIYDRVQGISAARIDIDVGDGELLIDEHGNEDVACCLAPVETDDYGSGTVILRSGNLDLRSISSMCVKGAMVINGGSVKAYAKDKFAFSQVPQFSDQHQSIYYYPVVTAGTDPQHAALMTLSYPYADLFLKNHYVQIDRAYRTIVGETFITADNKNDVLGDGTVRYVPATTTARAKLYLSGATVIGSVSNYEDAAIYAYENLDIIISGNVTLGKPVSNFMSPGDYSVMYGIFAVLYNGVIEPYKNYDVSISGSGTLNVNAIESGIMAKTISIDLNGDLIVREYGMAERACCLKAFDLSSGSDSAITLNSGNLDLKSCVSNCIYGNLTMNGGSVTAISLDNQSFGNYAFHTAPSFGASCFDNATVTLRAGDSEESSAYYPDASAFDHYTVANYVKLEIEYGPGIHTIGGKDYLFMAEGGGVCRGLTNFDGNYYYADESGVLQTGWIEDNGEWYYAKEDHSLATGWERIEKKWYYFKPDYYGVMQTRWQQIGGKWYYLGTDGAMRTKWQQIGGKWYYLGSDGAMRTKWQQIGGKWYYLGTDGAMRTGWQQISGVWYYLGSNGEMYADKWLKESGKWYYFKSDGAMAKSESITMDGKTYKFNASGVWTNT